MKNRQHNIIWLVSSAHFFSHFYYLLIPSLLPHFKNDLHVSYTSLGIALSCYGVTTTLAQVPAGMLVDRIGAPVVLISGLALNSLVLFEMGILSDYVQLVAMTLVLGVGDAVFHPANYSIIARAVDGRHFARAYSVHNFAGQLGFALAPLLTGIVAIHFSWRATGPIFGSIGLATAVLLLCHRNLLSTSLLPPIDTTSKEMVRSGWQLLLSGPILVSLFIFVGLGLLNSGARDFGVATLQAIYKIDAVSIGSVITAYLVASLVGIILGGWLAHRTKKYEMITSGGLLISSGLLFAVSAILPPYPALVVLYGLLGLASGAVASVRDILIRKLVPAHHAGKAFGFVTMGIGMASLIAPLLYGSMLDSWSPPNILFSVGCIGILTWMLLLAGRKSYLKSSQQHAIPAA